MTTAEGAAMGVHRETLHRRLRKLRLDAEAARRSGGNAGGLQGALEKQVRATGLPGTSSFEGKVASRWAPQRLEDFNAPRTHSFEQVLAVVAVWLSWMGSNTLVADGRVRQAWMASADCQDWRQLLDAAHQETTEARRRSPDAPSAQAEADAAVARYFERLVQSYGRLNLDVLGPEERAGEQPAIRLRQVFEVPLVAWNPPRPDLPARMWRELVERGELTEADLPPGLRQEEVVKWRKTRTERPPQPVLEAVASQEGRRLVLLGDPGAGKSTFARYLALALAGGLDSVPGELAELVGLVPVIVELRHLADGSRWQGRTVEDFWEEFNATERLCLPRNVLEYLLSHPHRPVVAIFDGLDEIFEPARRAEVARQVVAFAQAHSHVRVVVTSRVVGFASGVFTAAGFSQAKLEDLAQGQIESFIRHWYEAAHPTDPGEVSRLAGRLIDAVRGFASVAELAGNPLLLTILASIGLGATIPRDRREVYRRAVDVLTGRWDRDAKHLPLPRQDHPDVAAAIDELDAGLLQELLERLARQLQEGAGAAQTGTLISRTALTALIASYVTDMNYQPHVARIVAKAMVERLHERAFLIHPYGAGMYGFVHRTFLEYLAARDLSQRYTAREWTPNELIDMLAHRAADPTWHEVILLVVGQISRQAEAEHATFIARLLSMHRQRTTTAYGLSYSDSRFLELAIRALAESHRISRAPSRPPANPESSLAAQSDAVIDALIVHLDYYPWDGLNLAKPAITTFPWSWTGRERFLRWFYAQAATEPETWESALIAVSMCRNVQEAIRIAHISWATHAVILEAVRERWGDDSIREVALSLLVDATASEDLRFDILDLLPEIGGDNAYIAIRDLIRDMSTPTELRTFALTIIGRMWPDKDEIRSFALDLARNSTTPDDVRAGALRNLALRWPGSGEVQTAILNIASDPAVPDRTRAAALGSLRREWADDATSLVIGVARNLDAPNQVRAAAIEALRQEWSDEATSLLIDVARDPEAPDQVRAAALRGLGGWWNESEEARTTIRSVARDATAPYQTRLAALVQVRTQRTNNSDILPVAIEIARDSTSAAKIRVSALSDLGRTWEESEVSRTTIVDIIRDPTAPQEVRASALSHLERWWEATEVSRTAILDVACDPTAPEELRASALRIPTRPGDINEDRWTTILGIVCDVTAPDKVRAAALTALGDLSPDRDETRSLAVSLACDTTVPDEVRAAALWVLGEWWPGRDDNYSAILNIARDKSTQEMARVAALQLLSWWWPESDESHGSVLDTARDATAPDKVRAGALEMLAQRWPSEDVWFCAAHCAEKAELKTQKVAIRLLALLWPSRPETADLLARLSINDKSEQVRTCAAQALNYINRTTSLWLDHETVS
ncbi:NACHT domain-containing protein [Streptomyces sp. NPDC001137]|uniref:NACHT domain-containing protein n=1 Tax=Streptomyces sp. NPDC001137 TaxID=3154378 RepID=UPI0033275B52